VRFRDSEGFGGLGKGKLGYTISKEESEYWLGNKERGFLEKDSFMDCGIFCGGKFLFGCEDGFIPFAQIGRREDNIVEFVCLCFSGGTFLSFVAFVRIY